LIKSAIRYRVKSTVYSRHARTGKERNMRYFPINLAIRDQPVIVVGGGAVAARKCLRLLDAGARVTVIAPRLDAGLQGLLDTGKIDHLAREFAPGDLAEGLLAFAATDDPAVNRAVAEEARNRGILANVADAPELGTFTLPAVLTRGDLQVAVSTGGTSPALAQRVRDGLAGQFGPEYEIALNLLGALREKLLTEKVKNAYNGKIFNDLVDRDLPALIRNRSFAEIDHLLTDLFGPGHTMAELGVGEKEPE
jgi:precorrin-2 dehydrogenase/sirohydrochlorin ferrochelatase